MKRARGVALIIALVVVALATILATRIGAQGALSQRRGITLLNQEQSFELALGAEAWAIEILRDAKSANPHMDSLDQLWAQPLPPIPIGDGESGGTISGQIIDLQGRFNLNSLVHADGSKNQLAFEQFQRILQALGLETKWASQVLDWIDPDFLVDGVDGAEDSVYLSMTPPYRAANHLMTSTSELLALQGFGSERYRQLAPYVAALPLGAQLNVCTASGLVLDSLAPGLTAFDQDPKQLLNNRQKGCFPRQPDVIAAITPLLKLPGQLQLVTPTLAETTQWFQATVEVSLPTSEFRLYSLLQRNPGGFSRVILRTLGTE